MKHKQTVIETLAKRILRLKRKIWLLRRQYEDALNSRSELRAAFRKAAPKEYEEWRKSRDKAEVLAHSAVG